MLRKIGMRMNLQLLAANTGVDGGGAPSQTDGGTNNTNTGASEGSNTEGTENQTPSFDDVLGQNKAYKAEYDKRLKEALQAAQTEWETQQQEKITEAEKLKKMNADEKAKYQDQKRKEALDKREKDITTRELKAQARETLAEKNLPKELIDALNFDSAETCNASIEAVEKAFQSAVQKAVEDRLKGTKPVKPTSPADGNIFGFNFTGVRPKNK